MNFLLSLPLNIFLVFSNPWHFYSLIRQAMPHSNMDGASGGTDKVFCSKPARGWSHSDKVITNEGVTFNVRVCTGYWTRLPKAILLTYNSISIV